MLFSVSMGWVTEPKLTHTAVVADVGRGLLSNLKVSAAPTDVWEHIFIFLYVNESRHSQSEQGSER